MKLTLFTFVSLLFVLSTNSEPININNNDLSLLDYDIDDDLFDDYNSDDNDEIILSPNPPPIPKSSKSSPTKYVKQEPQKPVYVSWMAMFAGICANPKGCSAYQIPPKCNDICKYKIFQDVTKIIERRYNVEKSCSDCMIEERCRSQCFPKPTSSCNGCQKTYQF